ncbi:MAG: hypothetical protein ACLR1V_16535 [Coprococcus sp.]
MNLAVSLNKKLRRAHIFDGDHMTLQEFSEKWLAECLKPKKAITTYDNYKMNLENHILLAGTGAHMKLLKNSADTYSTVL